MNKNYLFCARWKCKKSFEVVSIYLSSFNQQTSSSKVTNNFKSNFGFTVHAASCYAKFVLSSVSEI
jgi:hypothetical protein